MLHLLFFGGVLLSSWNYYQKDLGFTQGILVVFGRYIFRSLCWVEITIMKWLFSTIFFFKTFLAYFISLSFSSDVKS